MAIATSDRLRHVSSTVSALPDHVLLDYTRNLARYEQAYQVLVLDHLREINTRRLFLRLGYGSLWEYVVRELEYSDGAAWRRIKAMRLCAETDGVRARLQDGSLSVSTAAELQNTFERLQRNGGRVVWRAPKAETPDLPASGAAADPAGRAPADGVAAGWFAAEHAARDQAAGGAASWPADVGAGSFATGPDDAPAGTAAGGVSGGGSAARDAARDQAAGDACSGPGDAAAGGSAAGLQPAMADTAPARPEVRPLDAALRQKLVQQAAGKSTREVKRLLAAVDPEVAAPRQQVRSLGDGRWTLKAVIDGKCQGGLEQLLTLLSHVDPHMTLGQLIGRLVQDGLDRYDPSRPPRRRARNARRPAPDPMPPADNRIVGRDAGGEADRPSTSAAKSSTRRRHFTTPAMPVAQESANRIPGDATPARTGGNPASPRKPPVCSQQHFTSAAKSAAARGRLAEPLATPITDSPDSGVKNGGAPVRPGRSTTSAAKSAARRGRLTEPPATPTTESQESRVTNGGAVGRPARSTTSAAKSAARRRGRRRAIPAAVRREVWRRDGGRCTFVDRDSGRRCGSRYLLEIDHVIPYALGGGEAVANLRTRCAAHHRLRHARRPAELGCDAVIQTDT